ncbi:hypothetical protein HPB47_027367, partial [Ixodes persulcatus]
GGVIVTLRSIRGFFLWFIPAIFLSNKGFPSTRTTKADKGDVLVMPPFSSGGQQLFQEDVDNTYHMAQ